MTAKNPKDGRARNVPNGGKGRPPGTPNKTTKLAKEAIAAAAEALGGHKRLAEWAKEDPKNEHTFWSVIYPKLVPVQVDGPGKNGAHVFEQIVRTIVDPKN
jgi:hypothetical protein